MDLLAFLLFALKWFWIGALVYFLIGASLIYIGNFLDAISDYQSKETDKHIEKHHPN
jgi:hypothetical protein